MFQDVPGSQQGSRTLLLLRSDRGPEEVETRLEADFRALGFEVHWVDPLATISELRAALLRYGQLYSRNLDLGELYLSPGLSSWAERTELPIVGREFGFQVLSPSARAISYFTNRLTFLSHAQGLGIPTLLAGPEPVCSLREIQQVIESRHLTMPLVLKPIRPGLGAQLFALKSPADFRGELPIWIEQITESLGDVLLLVEKFLDGARQISIPFVRMASGDVEYFPPVDSSLRTRGKRLFEVCPPPSLDRRAVEAMRAHSEKLLESIRYVGVGVLEYLVDGDRAYLIDGLPRLNETYPLWSDLSGTSAVAWQVAAPEIRSGQKGEAWGLTTPSSMARRCGIAVRLYAEDSLFRMPQAGRIAAHSLNEGVLWAYGDSSQVSPRSAGNLATVYAQGSGYETAREDARRLLEQIWVSGTIQTNERFVAALLEHPWVRAGIFHASFIDEEFIPPRHVSGEYEELFRGSLPSGFQGQVELGGQKIFAASHRISEDRELVRVGNEYQVVSRGAKGTPRFRAVIAGRIQSLRVQEGRGVDAHTSLAWIESMGVLVPHSLPVRITLKKWLVEPDQWVEFGQDLAEFGTES